MMAGVLYIDPSTVLEERLKGLTKDWNEGLLQLNGAVQARDSESNAKFETLERVIADLTGLL